MSLKIAVFIVLAALLLSLFSGFIFLIRDRGRTRRTVNSLGIRIALALVLMGLIVYGIYSGQFINKAPWDRLPPQSIEQKP